MKIKNNECGFILLLTLIFMTILTVFTGALIYMATADMKNVAPQSEDVNLIGLADAGINKAHRAIRDDYSGSAPSPGSATGVADLRGGYTGFSSGLGSDIDNMRYIDNNYTTINDNTDQAILSTFDSNYANTRIISVEIHAVAVRQGGNGSNNIVVGYTTDGSAYTTVINQAIPSSQTDLSVSVAGLTWSTIMSPNFRLRAMRTGTGNRNIRLYSMYLRVTYGIDTLRERWATGGYATFPISLSGGTIESITITDEESKVNLNYASQALLQNLLKNLGIADESAKATAIVNYRGVSLTNPFDSVEELQQVTVSGVKLSTPDYNAIKNYVTVYSFVNSNVYRPTGPRAPININTAPKKVLMAVFDSLTLGSLDSSNLADAIIAFRGSTPFKGFYTSTSTTDNTYFYNYVRNSTYLSTTNPQPNEKDRVMDNSDASSLIPFSGSTAFSALTTEFCYASTAFYIETVVSIGGRHLRVKTLRGNDYNPNRTNPNRTRTFTTYVGDLTFSGWRKENFE